MPIARFRSSTIEAVAAILGQTEGGLSNREIGDLLAAAKIADPRLEAEKASPLVQAGHPYVQMSRSERVRRALAEHQDPTHTGQALIGLLHAAMNPTRHVEVPATFTSRRDCLNEVLAFEGIEMGGDGRIHRRGAVVALVLSPFTRIDRATVEHDELVGDRVGQSDRTGVRAH